jgi:hypothetical protein
MPHPPPAELPASPEPAPAVLAHEKPATAREAAAAGDARCALELRVVLRKRSAARHELDVVAANRTGEPLRFSLPSRCPSGPFAFRGLPGDYDYYRSCAKGMCAEHTPESFALAPGERRVLGSTELAVGGGNCQPALAPKLYELTLELPELPFEVCTQAASLDLRSQPFTPARALATPSDPYACTGLGQCVLSCPHAAGCCSSAPCGCKHAIHRDHQARYEATYAKSCQRGPDCPVMGCAYEDATAVCRDGRCTTTSGPGF